MVEVPASRKPIGKKLRFDVLHRDHFTCQYCGAKPPAVVLHLDHRIAVAKGGQNTFENLMTSCAPCNIGKGVTDLTASVSAGEPHKFGRGAPRIEFFWNNEWEDKIEYLTAARILDFPSSFDTPEFHDSEYRRYCRASDPRYASYGFSTMGFNPHQAATKVFDLLGTHWRRSLDYVIFLDDILLMAEAGKLPEYIAPMVLRATHPEVCYARCAIRDRDYEDQMDAIAGQSMAVFAGFLAREANSDQSR